MILILTLVIVMSMLSVFIISSVKNSRSEVAVEFKATMMPWVFLSSAVMLTCDLVCGGENLPSRIVCDLLLSLLPAVVISDSLKTYETVPVSLKVIFTYQGAVSICYLLEASGILPVVGNGFHMALSSIYAGAVIVFYLAGIELRLREIKAVMRSGTVWSFVCLCVDVVYVTVPAAVVLMMNTLTIVLHDGMMVQFYVAAVLLALELLALGLRTILDTQFVIRQKHENIIVESMKISQMEMCGNSKDDEQYREIYERVVLHFEMSKPFLNGDLTINDIVKVTFSNKVYISKAISHYTGRNFKQFVNYHRVMYSMDLFRNRPELKVSELSEMSGFNTVVSFTMAFRLFVNETPSEWCRKERTKLLKTKN